MMCDCTVVRVLSMSMSQSMSFPARFFAYPEKVRDEYVRHFLCGEMAVGAETEAALGKALLPKVPLHPAARCCVLSRTALDSRSLKRGTILLRCCTYASH